jgi:RsmE family RNA methyltransferase
VNYLLLHKEEISGREAAQLEGKRLEALLKKQALLAGHELHVLDAGGRRGIAQVTALTPKRLTMSICWEEAPLARANIHAIVAVARPQTIKKVIHIATTLGLNSLDFVRSENSEKSYLQAHALRPENIAAEVALAQEQCGDPIMPSITVHRTFSRYLEKHLASELMPLKSPALFVAHTAPGQGLNLNEISLIPAGQPVYAAIGPESGWTENEFKGLKALGFTALSLGPRILRVEVALSVLLGTILSLRR